MSNYDHAPSLFQPGHPPTYPNTRAFSGTTASTRRSSASGPIPPQAQQQDTLESNISTGGSFAQKARAAELAAARSRTKAVERVVAEEEERTGFKARTTSAPTPDMGLGEDGEGWAVGAGRKYPLWKHASGAKERVWMGEWDDEGGVSAAGGTSSAEEGDRGYVGSGQEDGELELPGENRFVSLERYLVFKTPRKGKKGRGKSPVKQRQEQKGGERGHDADEDKENETPRVGKMQGRMRGVGVGSEDVGEGNGDGDGGVEASTSGDDGDDEGSGSTGLGTSVRTVIYNPQPAPARALTARVSPPLSSQVATSAQHRPRQSIVQAYIRHLENSPSRGVRRVRDTGTASAGSHTPAIVSSDPAPLLTHLSHSPPPASESSAGTGRRRPVQQPFTQSVPGFDQAYSFPRPFQPGAFGETSTFALGQRPYPVFPENPEPAGRLSGLEYNPLAAARAVTSPYQGKLPSGTSSSSVFAPGWPYAYNWPAPANSQTPFGPSPRLQQTQPSHFTAHGHPSHPAYQGSAQNDHTPKMLASSKYKDDEDKENSTPVSQSDSRVSSSGEGSVPGSDGGITIGKGRHFGNDGVDDPFVTPSSTNALNFAKNIQQSTARAQVRMPPPAVKGTETSAQQRVNQAGNLTMAQAFASQSSQSPHQHNSYGYGNGAGNGQHHTFQQQNQYGQHQQRDASGGFNTGPTNTNFPPMPSLANKVTKSHGEYANYRAMNDPKAHSGMFREDQVTPGQSNQGVTRDPHAFTGFTTPVHCSGPAVTHHDGHDEYQGQTTPVTQTNAASYMLSAEKGRTVLYDPVTTSASRQASSHYTEGSSDYPPAMQVHHRPQALAFSSNIYGVGYDRPLDTAATIRPIQYQTASGVPYTGQGIEAYWKADASQYGGDTHGASTPDNGDDMSGECKEESDDDRMQGFFDSLGTDEQAVLRDEWKHKLRLAISSSSTASSAERNGKKQLQAIGSERRQRSSGGSGSFNAGVNGAGGSWADMKGPQEKKAEAQEVAIELMAPLLANLAIHNAGPGAAGNPFVKYVAPPAWCVDNAANLRNTPQRSASGTFNHHSNIGKAGGYGASPSMAPGLRFPSTTSSASAHSLASTGSPTATASVAKGGMTVAGGGIRGDVGGAGGSSLLGESGEWKPPKRVGRDPRYPVSWLDGRVTRFEEVSGTGGIKGGITVCGNGAGGGGGGGVRN